MYRHQLVQYSGQKPIAPTIVTESTVITVTNPARRSNEDAALSSTEEPSSTSLDEPAPSSSITQLYPQAQAV
ncbi:hypothetical protein M408DRAFT_328349 [Serendipita vermifera MAFF 305830]|uniref:Uncharacterized protein n=1 Tax=Serendipita vermifera MAFF 305830 TaxID=933852 RepID=A0A0C2WVZ5_SERVB|nr:hypothetical protein M408DRAFT_328349 [Serendipita vermifera MAFF 305830]